MAISMYFWLWYDTLLIQMFLSIEDFDYVSLMKWDILNNRQVFTGYCCIWGLVVTLLYLGICYKYVSFLLICLMCGYTAYHQFVGWDKSKKHDMETLSPLVAFFF